MYLVDSSVWFALAVDQHMHHSRALNWFDSLDSLNSAYFCRSTQQSVLRLLTNKSAFSTYESSALTNQQAWEAYDSLLADFRVFYQAVEPSNLAVRWRLFASRDSSSPHLWMDAYLAAFAWSSGDRLVTIDAGFRQFEGLDLLVLGDSGN